MQDKFRIKNYLLKKEEGEEMIKRLEKANILT